MPSSIPSGAVFGVGVYGTDIYNVASITVIPDGVSATAVLNNTLQIEGNATLVVTGVFASTFINNVAVSGEAIVIPTGVEATGSIGTVAQVTVNRVPVTGVVGTTEIGDITLETNNYLDVGSVVASGQIGNVVVAAKAVVTVTGVFATGFINDNLVILENEVVIPPSVSATGAVGIPVVTGVIFDFNTVANLYSRSRVAYVFRRTTSKDRTVIIPAK
jgi:hypothetical protein